MCLHLTNLELFYPKILNLQLYQLYSEIADFICKDWYKKFIKFFHCQYCTIDYTYFDELWIHLANAHDQFENSVIEITFLPDILIAKYRPK